MNRTQILEIGNAILISVIVVALITGGYSLAEKNNIVWKNSHIDEIVLMTEPLRFLDPHSHGAEDSVGDDHHGVMVYAPDFIMPEDVWVNKISLEMQGAPKVTLHHLNLFYFVPTGTSAEGKPSIKSVEVVSFGQDTADNFIYREPYSVFIPKGANLKLSVMLHNPLPPKGPGGVYENVSVGVRLSGPTHSSERVKQVQLRRLTLSDEESRTQETFKVPANTMHYVKTAENDVFGKASYTFTKPATIIRMGAHLHAWEGGEQVDAYLNGKHLASFKSRKNGPNNWDWFTEASNNPIHVNAGDTITLSSTYSNPGDVPLAGAMGMLSFRYAEEEVSESRTVEFTELFAPLLTPFF